MSHFLKSHLDGAILRLTKTHSSRLAEQYSKTNKDVPRPRNTVPRPNKYNFKTKASTSKLIPTKKVPI